MGREILIKKRKLASDIEAVGFYEDVHTPEDIHCLCSIDIDTNEVFLFHDHPEFDNQVVIDPYDNKSYSIPARSGTLEDGIRFWRESALQTSVLIIHNAHTYDRVIIDKVWPDNGIPFEAYHDTFNQSKLQWYERPCPRGAKSPHGLRAYGILSGVNKPEVTDWKTIDAFKLHRCIEDCKIQAYTYNYLEKERLSLKESFGCDFAAARKIEDLYAAECAKQEIVGVKVDVPHIKACIEDLDIKIETLRAEIEPHLPPTITGEGSKVSRSEMATLFGYDGSKVKDKTLLRKKDSVTVEVIDKPYFKPVMNYTNKIKGTFYSGYHLEHGFSPKFEKNKELKDWIKETTNTKPKEWSIDKEEVIVGEVINHHTCNFFDIKPEDTHLIGGPFTKISINSSTMTQTDVVKAYLVTLGWRDAESWNLKKDVEGNYIKVTEKTVVRWPENALPHHQLVKVIPKGGYMVSSPELTEEDYKQLPEGIGKKIAEYNTYQHRRRFLENPKDPENKGLLCYVREDGRIPAGVNNFGTRSGRGSQRLWVNAPAGKALYGKEIRKCIIAEEGKVLVGIDMKSAQLSIAAYYANNQEYYESVATGIEKDQDGKYVGQSAHCVNARMFGMVSEADWGRAVETQDHDLIERLTIIRSNSKGGSFAVIFGASGKKVAVTIGIPESEGNKRRDQFLKQMGLDSTIAKLAEFEAKYPYKRGFMLPLAFGYWLWNNSSHKSVNTIVQGFEALAQKLAVIRMSREFKRLGLDDHVKKVIDTHDEVLLEVTEGYQDQAGNVAGDAYTWAADQIFKYHVRNPKEFANFEPPKFPIDLNGGYKVGTDYYQTH